MLTVRPPSRGFTITEMLVAIAIVAILLGLGVPSITGYIEAAKLNAAAQSYLSGVQTARATAIRQNLRTEFVLTDTPVETANLADNLVAIGQRAELGGSRRRSHAAAAGLPSDRGEVGQREFRHRGAVRSDRRASARRRRSPASSRSTASAARPTRTTTRFLLQNPRGGACAPAGPMRCPTILVPAGGLARICDPLVTAATDSRGC